VGEFKPSRDQRQACHRWNRFVLGDEYVKEAIQRYPKSKSEKNKEKNEFNLVSAVRSAEYSSIRTPPEPAHRFEVTLEPGDFTQEKYDLYLNYQISVHKEDADDNSPSQFKRFLCDSPLERETRMHNGITQKLGSYHQMYRFDGRLIAIGVLDLLPGCVSGVYFIYHSDFEKWSFGKLSALREACLALEGQYDYYYMGFYIHSCPKMRYKGHYHLQYFLDVATFQWDPLNEANTSLMDKHHFLLMSELRERSRLEGVELSDLEDIHDPSMTAAKMEHLHNDLRKSLFNLQFPGMMKKEDLNESSLLADLRYSQDEEIFEIDVCTVVSKFKKDDG
jgi:arginyl-tRNA---protein transferase